LLTVLILLATGVVGARTYLLWKEGPWDLPTAAPARPLPPPHEEKSETKAPTLVGTETIVSKNLFDPERGESRSREVETNSRSFQRVRGLVLLGTAILGNNRYAVVRDGAPTAVPGVPGQSAAGQTPNLMRLKLGDNLEGFRLAEIGDKRVVFTKGPARVEVLLDYFRKPEPQPGRPTPPVQAGAQPPPVVPRRPVPGAENAPQPQVAQPTPVPRQVPLVPRVLPNLPRRERIPAPDQ
jgi:hypothetical protein